LENRCLGIWDCSWGSQSRLLGLSQCTKHWCIFFLFAVQGIEPRVSQLLGSALLLEPCSPYNLFPALASVEHP
jgi:hypothetical protein